jgi:hypothetical protein
MNMAGEGQDRPGRPFHRVPTNAHARFFFSTSPSDFQPIDDAEDPQGLSELASTAASDGH